MKPGEIVVLNDEVAIYGKLSYRAFTWLKYKKLLGRFNLKLSFPHWTLPRKIKAGNKFLKKHKLDAIEMLTDQDIKEITLHQEAPVGSLVCRLPKKITREMLRNE